MIKKRWLIFSIFLFFTFCFCSAEEFEYKGIGYLKYFERAYPDIKFLRRYDGGKDDWIIIVNIPEDPDDENTEWRTAEFYWANGSFIPAEELENKDNYVSLLYFYPKFLDDPENYTEAEREEIRIYGEKENRKNGAGAPMFLFDFIYESSSRRKIETHIKRIPFLGVKTNVHDRIIKPLEAVNEQVMKLAETDEEVKEFLNNLKSIDGYLWRIIEGTNRKSFHSIGIAIDILPTNLKGRQIFWSWAKDKYPNDWMLVPLKNRWIPPQKVIDIFEENGFIWGGKWVIYDNMHFEYHPELIEYNYRK